MKIAIIHLLALFSLNLVGQHYDGLAVSDKKDPDADNQLFTPGRTFIFTVEWDQTYADQPQEVSYFVLSPKKSEKTNKNQTEVVISYEPDKGVYQSTGIVENASNLWLHPPRSNFFSALETCPFPYIKFPLKDGSKWTEQLLVGDQWSNGKWEGNLLLEITYEVKKRVSSERNYWIIEASSKSKAGISKSTFFFNKEEGFLEMIFETLEEQTIHLKLDRIIDGKPMLSLSEYLLSKRTGNDFNNYRHSLI